MRHAGQHRSPRAQPNYEAGSEDRLVTVPREEQLGSCDVLRPHAEQRAEALHERPAASVTEEVTKVRAGGRADEAEEDDQDDAVVPRGRPGAGGKQQQLARERHACALDQDSKTRRGVPQRVDDSSRVHSGSYTGVPDGRLRGTRVKPGPPAHPAALDRASSCCGRHGAKAIRGCIPIRIWSAWK